jgi:hypothetical protein
MTASPEQVEAIYRIGGFNADPQRDKDGRIIAMESSLAAVNVEYNAGEQQVYEVTSTPEGDVISPIPSTVDFAGQQLVHVLRFPLDKTAMHITLFDPSVRFVPEDHPDPNRAVLTDREGRTVIFERDAVFIRSQGLPLNRQD